IEARGGKTVSEAIIQPLAGGSEHSFECDLVVVSGGTIPATSLLLQSGAKSAYDSARGHFALSELPAGVFAAGEVAGADGDALVAASGELAGLEAAHALGLGDDASAKRVTELSKRYTTVTMGPCQGRMCQLPSVKLMAQETGQGLDQVGVTTARPPWVSVPMGILGGRDGLALTPAKRSAIHDRHRDLNGTIKWAGDWQRAYDYGDPEGEALNVNKAAGIIDVSTLGKLIVRGPDAGEFLDRLYPNRFSNLKPGRIRYGVISSDAGRIVDDGTICRIDDETFYVTTTSSGAGAIYDWFTWWLADWQLEVHIADVTQALSAVNLAG